MELISLLTVKTQKNVDFQNKARQISWNKLRRTEKEDKFEGKVQKKQYTKILQQISLRKFSIIIAAVVVVVAAKLSDVRLLQNGDRIKDRIEHKKLYNV